MEEQIKRLREIKKKAFLGGGDVKIAKQHEKGKLTARERIERLLDAGSFVETDMLARYEDGAPGDGLVAGYGMIEGRLVSLYAQDCTVMGGSIGEIHQRKMAETIERALDMGVPFIGLDDSPGARVAMGRPEDGSKLVAETSPVTVFFPNTQASGAVPQISAILGACAGISVYSPALTDFVFMVDGISQMFITGPRVVKSVTHEDISMEQLGGARVHCQISGVADFRTKSEDECFQMIRKLLGFLPPNNKEAPPVIGTGDDANRMDDTLAQIVPTDPGKSYDMHRVISRLVDNGDFFEVKAEFAREIIVGFGRLDGYTVGIVANQPMVLAGCLTVDSSDKQARFIRFCDAFNIPLVLLVDTPAYLPGTRQEQTGIIRHGAKVIYALCESIVPRIAVVLRKCYGGGNLGMGVRPGMGTDFVFAWPIAEIGVMGAEQSVELLYGDEIKDAENPEEFRKQKVTEYRNEYANPLKVASDAKHTLRDIIEPRETRRVLITTLRLLRGKSQTRYPKRHGNIPL
ncbi:acyl-CoA carboxylase subunit beta [Chloroflexota bacterium]